ncbi:MAG: hypothetical protein ACR2HZ_11470, partial [Gemmatimonadaceae bacterium]
MDKYTRGEFLGLSALLAGAATLDRFPLARGKAIPAGPSAPADAPDFILVNGRVITMDPALAAAEAFAVRFGRFTAVGSSADVRNLATRSTPVVDAG